MNNSAKHILSFVSHIAASCLAVIGLAAILPIGITFNVGVLPALVLTALFVVFAMVAMIGSNLAICTLFNLKHPGTFLNFISGGLIGSVFFALCSWFAPAVLEASGIGGALSAGFCGSLIVVLLGLTTGQINGNWAPVRKG